MPSDFATPPGERQHTIAAIGEVLWDVFPTGPRFGGAPANFACTFAGLTGDRAMVSMVSAVGTDELGTQAIAALQNQNVRTNCVAQLEKPTGTVDIALDESGSATYRFADDTAWDNLSWRVELEQLAAQASAVCFGTLGQRSDLSRVTIQRFVDATTDRCLRVFDVNLRPPFYTEPIIRESLQLANVLKLNDEELPLLAKIYGLSGDEGELLNKLAATCELQVVALTRGPRGAAIFRGGQLSDCSGVSTDVVDTVGAGDAFTATMTLGLLEDKPTDEINRRACEVAAFVCSQAGASPRIPKSLAKFSSP